MGIIFCSITVIPLIESSLILAGLRPNSTYNPRSEGLLVFLTAITQPIASGVKYAYMDANRFNTEVLGNKNNALKSMIADSQSDETVDAIGKWLSALSDNLIISEVRTALWRSGDYMDGKRFLLSLVGTNSNKDQSPTKRSKAGMDDTTTQISLEQLLVSTVQQRNGKSLWQFNRKYHKFIYPFIISLVIFVNPLYRVFVLGVPMFGIGNDWLEMAACICTFIMLGLNFVTGELLRPLIAASGHLNRHRKILEGK